ncbi:MAG: T9SS type A sorting domain-containing protein, partial [Bacteroidales bacterium]|nr:T9SS type A sorting domain-containing protein [Bacteroidales bacterium]
PYSVTYSGIAAHNGLYYSPMFERYVADSLVITSPMLTGNDSLIDIICHVTDGIGRTLTDTIQVNVACLVNSIRTTNIENGITVYPNPADNEITIKFTKNIENVKIKIFNSLGQIVYSSNTKNDFEKIDISKFTSGIYLISILNNQYVYTKKIVIK